MIYWTEGKHKNTLAVDIYVQNLCHALSIGHLVKIELNIKFVNKCETDVMGFCYDGDKAADIYEIEIEIAKNVNNEPLTFFEQMNTLAHEMVHVKQFVRGEYPSEREAKKLEFELYGKCFPWNLVR